MNPKSRARMQGHVMRELQSLNEEQQEIALYHLLVRIKELKQESNIRSHNKHQSPDNWTRNLL
jgi:hypothetical protein